MYTVAETSGVNIGMAPEAKLAFIDLSSMRDGERIVTPGDLANDYFRNSAEVGATVNSDSWGSLVQLSFREPYGPCMCLLFQVNVSWYD